MSERAIPFVKMSGSGNDFIMVDNRAGILDPDNLGDWIRAVCRRRVAVGADGVILLQDDPLREVDFAWRFFNNDGGEAEMCGNGGRCAVRWAHELGLAGAQTAFRTQAGVIRGWVLGGREVRVQLTEAHDYRPAVTLALPTGSLVAAFLNTGVPHAVLTVDDAQVVDVEALGRAIRRHEAFAPQGTNVNFVQVTGEHDVLIRTYERGVEGETLACGTGCAAAAATLALAGKVQKPVRLTTRSGEVLTVDYQPGGEVVTGLTLQGPVRYVARGEIPPEAWE